MGNIYQIRRQNLANKLHESSVLLLHSGKAKHKTTDQFFHYVPNRNFFYLTGLEEENVILMMVKDKDALKEYLFIEETTEHMRQWVGEKISKEEASIMCEVPVANIRYLKSFDNMFNALMSYSRGLGIKQPSKLYLDLSKETSTTKPLCYSQFSNVLSIYKELQIKNANEHISYLRMFKSDDEINDLKKAINITELGLERIMKSIKVRENESQVQADFIHEITLQGSEGYSFNTILANGENATVLHYENNDSELDKENLILCDLGALYKNYGADITRTYPVSGTFTDRQKAIYEVVLKCNKKTIEFVKPGITWKELNDFARSILIDGAKELGLIKEDQEIGKYYYHSIGHFLGLDVHDVGHYNLKLEEGMVITIEPGLYIKEEKIGVRIEDDILITKDGYKNLSENIIKEVKDIEEYMN